MYSNLDLLGGLGQSSECLIDDSIWRISPTMFIRAAYQTELFKFT